MKGRRKSVSRDQTGEEETWGMLCNKMRTEKG